MANMPLFILLTLILIINIINLIYRNHMMNEYEVMKAFATAIATQGAVNAGIVTAITANSSDIAVITGRNEANETALANLTTVTADANAAQDALTQAIVTSFTSRLDNADAKDAEQDTFMQNIIAQSGDITDVQKAEILAILNGTQ